MRFVEPGFVARVNDVNHGLGIQIVMFPQRAELGLTAHVPNREFQIFVLHRLNVETDRGNRLGRKLDRKTGYFEYASYTECQH